MKVDRKRLRSLGMVLLFSLAACSTVAQPVGTQDDGGPVEDVVTMLLRLSASGAVEASTEGLISVRRVTLLNENLAEVKYFGLEPAEWVAVSSTHEMKASVNLIPFTGDDRYVIPASAGDPAIGGTLSNVRLEVREINQVETLWIYPVLLQPCEVTISESGDRGLVACPELSDGEGSVAMKMEWSRPG